MVIDLKKQGNTMIGQRIPLKCLQHHPIFLALLKLSIAFPALSSENLHKVQVGSDWASGLLCISSS